MSINQQERTDELIKNQPAELAEKERLEYMERQEAKEKQAKIYADTTRASLNILREAVDPWQHRSEHMLCSTCMWFVEKKRPEGYMGEVSGKIVGRCRKHAPTMNGYPVVINRDWCGDHKLNEGAAS